MKRTKIIYWVCTVLFGGFMLFSAIPDIVATDEAVAFMKGLGYPEYIIPFLGVAKLAGVMVILNPGFPRVKEWAYAGLFFDLAGAVYSIIASMGLSPGLAVMLIPFALGITSYILFHRLQAVAK